MDQVTARIARFLGRAVVVFLTTVLVVVSLVFAVTVGSEAITAEHPVVMGDMTVVGKDLRPVGGSVQACIRYRAFGRTEETCVPGAVGTALLRCFNDARVGLPLPDSCR